MYCGFLIDSDFPKYIGILTPEFSEKNLPKSTEDDKSYWYALYFCLSFTFFSILPKPMVLKFPEIVTLPRSASLAVNLPLAAQPPYSSKSVRRSSFTQIWPHLDSPSSSLLKDVFLGFLTPIIIVFTWERFGFPTTVILPPEAYFIYGDDTSALLKFLSCLASWKISKAISISLDNGHISAGEVA